MELRHALVIYAIGFASITAIDASRQSDQPSPVNATIASVSKHPRSDAARDRDTGYTTHSRNLVQSLQSISKHVASSKSGKFTAAQQRSIDGETHKAIEHALNMLATDARVSDDQIAETRKLVLEVINTLIHVQRQVH